jgi:hypothetical protein
MKTFQILIASAFLITACQVKSEDEKWISLFDGKSLEGWEIHSGTAAYEVDNGAILGTAVEGSPNTFLCTKKEYGDFILEFEVKNDPDLNSGVQIRSKLADDETYFWFRGNEGEVAVKKLPQDRLYGYQVEISNEAQGMAGQIYDEARRAFMFIESANEDRSNKGFKDNQWNKYRIECKGSSIKTWINDVPVADIMDSNTASGLIGLQVHSVPRDFKPYEVRWRNIRIREL